MQVTPIMKLENRGKNRNNRKDCFLSFFSFLIILRDSFLIILSVIFSFEKGKLIFKEIKRQCNI